MSKELDKLFRAYDKAEYALIKARDELFPVWTKARSPINPDMVVTVRDGSFFAHQVNTDWGHMSWRYLEKVEESSVREGS